jgi:pSer/pThr/pTyr-binding forkhead associated (FHA) protein
MISKIFTRNKQTTERKARLVDLVTKEEYVIPNHLEIIRIGRSEENDIQLTNGRGGEVESSIEGSSPILSVSRCHGVFVKTEEGYLFTDNNSRNGSTINGEKAKQFPNSTPLRYNDVLTLGHYKLQFIYE